jgi:hypothetical protein
VRAHTIRTLLLYACTDDNSTFSYQRAWPRHFAADPAFACTSLNVADRTLGAKARLEWASRSYDGDVIVLLHSVFSNALMLSPRVIEQLARRPQPKVYFIGNEYKLMPEKMAFCDQLGVALLISQSLSPDVHTLYRRRLQCQVTGIPNTGLDAAVFFPAADPDGRPIDLGYRAADAPMYLGHRERTDLAEFFTANAGKYGLTIDISLDRSARLDEAGWAAFLNRCKGQLGSEAGGDYFDLEDRTRRAVSSYVSSHPTAAFSEIAARFFPPPYEHVPLRILSGRHVEAAGTKTAQVLIEGRYDGLFNADEHYIPIRRDFSDADEAMRKFSDRNIRRAVADRAYDFVREHLTYERLMARVREVVEPLVH